MSRDIAVGIVTVDRTPKPNYLRDTLDNLSRSGVFTSGRLHSAHLVDSGSGTSWPERVLRGYAMAGPECPDVGPCTPLRVHHSDERRSGKANCAATLKALATSGAAWCLTLEDDLDVCDDFLGSVGRWLDWYSQSEPRPLYSFASNHQVITTVLGRGHAAWEYPVAWFWGFQAFAMRPTHAMSLAEWLEMHPLYVHTDGRLDPNAHDLEAHHWAHHHGQEFFRASAPSFVQHIGYETSIADNVAGGQKVTFPSWPGREWRY